MKFIVKILALFLCTASFAQEKQDAKSISKLFATSDVISWSVPIPSGESLPIEWHLRSTSMDKEGIRTFVGYRNNSLVGTLSMDNKGTFIGSIFGKNGYELNISNDGNLVVTQKKTSKAKCGTHSQHTATTQRGQSGFRSANRSTSYDLPSLSDGVFREYRLAVMISYKDYASDKFDKNINKIHAFWAEIETFLNEIFVRDVGIRFKMVKDDRLIITDPKKANEIYNVLTVTKVINNLIGEENYDAGATYNKVDGNLAGLTATVGAINGWKGSVLVHDQELTTLAHEMGHLFGANHPYSIPDGLVILKAEPQLGQSVVSYNEPFLTSFLGLANIIEMQQHIKRADKTHIPTHKAQNTPPTIDKDKMQEEYLLPKGSYFKIPIYANDIEQKELYYTSVQYDYKLSDKASRYIVSPPQRDHNLYFMKKYGDGNGALIPSSDPVDNVGTYHMLLAVSDAPDVQAAIDNKQAPLYDTYLTRLKVVEATPFKITSEVKPQYKTGEKFILKWSVDSNFFPKDSKVRISLSDDFGKTYKHILVPSTENDGECEVVMPQTPIGKIDHYPVVPEAFVSGLGILKIEVIDGLVFDISDHRWTAGIEVVQSNLTFHNLPKQNYVTLKEGEQIPAKANVTASCNGKNIDITYKESQTNGLITRTWSAECGSEKGYYVQNIYIQKTLPKLTFVELPEDKEIQCKNDLPNPTNMKVKESNDIVPTFTETSTKIDNKRNKIVRTWKASASGYLPVSHTQTLIVGDTQKPVFSSYPPDKVIKSEAEVPQQEELTATDNCDTFLQVIKSSITKVINGKNVIERVWITEDSSHNEERYVQHITIDPDIQPKKPFEFIRTSLPSDITISCASDIPTPQTLQTQGGCGLKNSFHSDKRTLETCEHRLTIERTYTAVDDCGTSISHKQLIKIEDNTPPVFEGVLPKNITIIEGESIPEQKVLTAKDLCSGVASVTPSQTREGNKIIYQWVAKDLCNNETIHKQIITINKPKPAPIPTPPPTPKPSPAPIPKVDDIIIYNGVSQEGDSMNYFKIENTTANMPIRLIIFNEIGLIVYKSDHYQENGELFKGYSNLSSVVGKGSALPRGTYFYIIEYYHNSEQQVKKGFLYVK